MCPGCRENFLANGGSAQARAETDRRMRRSDDDSRKQRAERPSGSRGRSLKRKASYQRHVHQARNLHAEVERAILKKKHRREA